MRNVKSETSSHGISSWCLIYCGSSFIHSCHWQKNLIHFILPRSCCNWLVFFYLPGSRFWYWEFARSANFGRADQLGLHKQAGSYDGHRSGDGGSPPWPQLSHIISCIYFVTRIVPGNYHIFTSWSGKTCVFCCGVTWLNVHCAATAAAGIFVVSRVCHGPHYRFVT